MQAHVPASVRREWRDEVLDTAAERFERRLTEELGKIRIEMANLRADLHEQIAAMRVEILRWSFLFWIGQLAAITGLLAFMT